MRAFDAARPGECANDVTSAGNREDQQETGAEPLNIGEDLADAGAPHEVGKQQQTQQTEYDSKWRKSAATRPLLTGINFRTFNSHQGTVPHAFSRLATAMPPSKLSQRHVKSGIPLPERSSLDYDATFTLSLLERA